MAVKMSKTGNAIALIIIAGIVARLALWSIVPVTGDAVYHYSIARFIAATGRIPSFEFVTGGDPMWYPPAFHILASVFYAVAGSEKVTPLALSILSLFAYYILLKTFYKKLLLPGMALAAFLPVQVYYGAIGYVDCLFLLLAPLILYFYLSFLKKKDYLFLAVTLMLSAVSFLTHYHGFIPIAAIATHLFFRNKKAAVAFFIAGIAIASPWYLRNYAVFGNPVWPLLFDGKYPAHEGYQPREMANILTVGKWQGLFFEYWMGAPNSGEDLARNIGIAGRYIPFPYAFFIGWLAVVLAGTALTAYGTYALLRSDRNRSLFIALLALSLVPLLLSNFIRMLMFAFPVFILGLATGLERLTPKVRRVFLPLGILALLAPTFAYAAVYHNIVGNYAPFYEEVNAQLPKDAVVCNMMDDVFFDRVDRTIVSIGTAGPRVSLECLSGGGDQMECFRKFGITHTCCTSLRAVNIGGVLKTACDELGQEGPVIAYEEQGVWGRCWSVT